MICLFQCLLTLNKLALTLSPTSKLRILEECEEMTSQKAKEMASSCCLCNLVGDNCDFRIQPRHVTGQHQVKDCHFFGLLLIFSRLSAEMLATDATNTPAGSAGRLNPENFLLNSQERQSLLSSYKVMLGRLMVKNLPAFKWLENILPHHIPHQYAHITSKKSTIIPQKLILKDEKKYEDCVGILQEAQCMLTECFKGLL